MLCCFLMETLSGGLLCEGLLRIVKGVDTAALYNHLSLSQCFADSMWTVGITLELQWVLIGRSGAIRGAMSRVTTVVDYAFDDSNYTKGRVYANVGGVPCRRFKTS